MNVKSSIFGNVIPFSLVVIIDYLVDTIGFYRLSYLFTYRRKQMKKKGDTLELKTNDVLHGESFSHELFFIFKRLVVRFKIQEIIDTYL